MSHTPFPSWWRAHSPMAKNPYEAAQVRAAISRIYARRAQTISDIDQEIARLRSMLPLLERHP